MTTINYNRLSFDSPIPLRQPGALRRYGKKTLAVTLPVVLTGMVSLGVREFQRIEDEYRSSRTAGSNALSNEKLARRMAVDSMFGSVQPPSTPPKPVTKVIGAIAMRKDRDSAGKDIYAYIQNPAIVKLPDGTHRAIGEPLPDSQISVLDGYVLCGPNPEPESVEQGPLGYSLSGFADRRIGSLRSSYDRPDGCIYEYPPPKTYE